MSHDLNVSFSKWPADPVGVWSDALAQMGIDAEFHPDFDPIHDANWCPVVLSFESDTELPVDEKLRGFGRFESGFEYYPSDSGAMFSSTSQEGSLAAFVCACALAGVTGGEVSDPQTGEKASGTGGLEVLERLFPEATVLEGPRKPIRFKGWDNEEEDDDEVEDEDEDEDDDDEEPEL